MTQAGVGAPLPFGLPGEPRYGTWVKLASLETVELIARAGFDFVVIDLEHSPLTLEAAYASLVVAQGFGLTVLARLPDRSGSHVQRLLDAGFDGLLTPQVSGEDEAAAVMRQMTFPPEGTRGMGLTSRAGRWGLEPSADYLARGTNNLIRGIQLESREALVRAEAVLDTPGVNAALVGMADLSLSAGLPMTDPGLQQLTASFLELAHSRHIAAGTAVQSPAGARLAKAQGFSFILVSNDASIFAQAVTTLAAQLRES